VADRAYRAFLCLGALVVAGYLALPTAARDVVYLAVGVVGAVAIVVGVRVHRPVRRAPWWLMAAGQLTWSGGDAVYLWYERVLFEPPFPSAADALYLAAYPLFALAFALLIRGRRSGRDRDGLIDSAIFTIGLGLLSWVFLMRPAVLDDSVDLLARAIGLAYPLGDILLLGVMVRLLAGSGGRTASFWLLAIAAGLMLSADTIFAVLTMTSSYDVAWVDLLWLGSYVLWGAAALHPSMRSLSEPSPDSTVPFTRRRLVALTIAILASPATLALQLLLGLTLDGWSVVISSTLLSVLVVMRMSGLLARLQAQAGQLAELARTDALTGLPNRRSADAELARRQARARVEAVPLAIAMVDVDRFKVFNDTFGHQAGDRLLAQAAAAWRRELGTDGFVARYGGEEFLFVLLGHDEARATATMDRARGVMPLGQTLSAGVAVWDGSEESQALVHRADVALYQAKKDGRDRVVPARTGAETSAARG
jgi:diguanylate cyclase (GGDEF)-like protein